MDINRKIELATASIASITRHDDADTAIRGAALDKLIELIGAERAAMNERVQDRIKEALAPRGAA